MTHSNPNSQDDELAELVHIFEGEVLTEEDMLSTAVQQAAERIRIQELARELVAREKAGEIEIPAPVALPDLLAMSDEEVEYRVDGLLLRGGRALLAAQFKAGKTTLTGNLVRCLADGERFLGRFDTEQVRRVTLIDTELTPRTIQRWLRDQGIRHPEAVSVLPIRGAVSSFNILDTRVRARWVEMIRGSEVLILDCLRPVMDALGLDEHRDAGRLLVAFDELMAEAGVEEGFVVHHMGHSGERARGDSRILDWPDAIWKIVRDDPEDDASARFFSAFGRDVEVTEGMLSFDPATRGLTMGDVSRQEVRQNRKAEAKAERDDQARRKAEEDLDRMVAAVRAEMATSGDRTVSLRKIQEILRAKGRRVTNGSTDKAVKARLDGSADAPETS